MHVLHILSMFLDLLLHHKKSISLLFKSLNQMFCSLVLKYFVIPVVLLHMLLWFYSQSGFASVVRR